MRFVGDSAPISAFGPALCLFNLIQEDFKQDLKGRLRIIPDVDKYRIKEDPSIFDQVKTEKYDYDVFFDGEFVSGFNIMDHPQRARINFLKGFKRLLQDKKIFINKEQYEINARIEEDNKLREKAEREAKRKKPKTKEEKIIDMAVRKALNIDKK